MERKKGICLICGGVVVDGGGDLDAIGNQAYTAWEGCEKEGHFYHFACIEKEE